MKSAGPFNGEFEFLIPSNSSVIKTLDEVLTKMLTIYVEGFIHGVQVLDNPDNINIWSPVFGDMGWVSREIGEYIQVTYKVEAVMTAADEADDIDMEQWERVFESSLSLFIANICC